MEEYEYMPYQGNESDVDIYLNKKQTFGIDRHNMNNEPAWKRRKLNGY